MIIINYQFKSQCLLSSDGLQQLEKLLRIPADFIWHTSKRPTIRTDDKTIVNKFAGSYFTSKVIRFINALQNKKFLISKIFID